MKPRIYAWSFGNTTGTLAALVEPFGDNLGLVLYPNQYDQAARLPGAIAYVNSLAQAKKAVATGYPWHALIVGDEPNLRESPENYQLRLGPTLDYLVETGLPVSTAGLALEGGRWKEFWFAQDFPDAYHRMMPVTGYAGFNVIRGRRHEVESVLERYPDLRWTLTAIPYRRWPNRWLQDWLGLSLSEWLEVAKRPNVHALGLWSLRSNGQFGIYEADGNLSSVGRRLLRLLGEA